LRTIVDLASVAAPEELEAVIDRALATKLVSVPGLEAAVHAAGLKGRPGIEALRSVLVWRSPADLAPSVLESRALRLLRIAGLKPQAVEVKAGADLSYRVDILMCPGLAVEVDGYSFHHSAEQMAEDARRRNRLFLDGTRVLVYTWRDITHDGRRVIAEVRNGIAHLAGPTRALRPPAH
jgi:very-short-patch-repair endonuclease